MNDLFSEFKTFLLRGNVVDLAVAVVIGAAFGAVVNSLVSSFITPLIAMILGEPSLASLDFTINDAVFTYGAFLDTLIYFLSVAAAIFFFVVKPVNILQAKMKKEEEEQPEETPADILLLREIRDALRARQ